MTDVRWLLRSIDVVWGIMEAPDSTPIGLKRLSRAADKGMSLEELADRGAWGYRHLSRRELRRGEWIVRDRGGEGPR